MSDQDRKQLFTHERDKHGILTGYLPHLTFSGVTKLTDYLIVGAQLSPVFSDDFYIQFGRAMAFSWFIVDSDGGFDNCLVADDLCQRFDFDCAFSPLQPPTSKANKRLRDHLDGISAHESCASLESDDDIDNIIFAQIRFAREVNTRDTPLYDIYDESKMRLLYSSLLDLDNKTKIKQGFLDQLVAIAECSKTDDYHSVMEKHIQRLDAYKQGEARTLVDGRLLACKRLCGYQPVDSREVEQEKITRAIKPLADYIAKRTHHKREYYWFGLFQCSSSSVAKHEKLAAAEAFMQAINDNQPMSSDQYREYCRALNQGELKRAVMATKSNLAKLGLADRAAFSVNAIVVTGP